MQSATTVCSRFALTIALVGLGACVAEPEGVRWDAPFGGSIDQPDEDEEDDADTSPTGPADSGHDDGPPKPTSDSQGESETETDGDTAPSDDDTGGPATTWEDVDDTSSSGAVDEDDDIPPADSGMDADPGTQPASGPWSSCEGTTCEVGMGCLQGQVQGATCTVACAGFDPASCPASPGETVDPVCISVLGQGVCALDCTGGLQCPIGMTCVVDNDDNGPIEVCL